MAYDGTMLVPSNLYTYLNISIVYQNHVNMTCVDFRVATYDESICKNRFARIDSQHT
jgi:hypothetical protein